MSGLNQKIEQLLQDAIQRHQVGALHFAEGLYRQILQESPKQPDAMHLLGVIAYQTGRYDFAEALIRDAIMVRPDFAEAWNNLGVVLRDAGRSDEAAGACRQAIALRPDFSDAFNNLGNALRDQKYLSEAATAYRTAIAQTPNFSEAFNNLGAVLKDLGESEQAITAFRQALAFKPEYVDAYSNLLFTMHLDAHLDADAIAEEHRRWNRRYAEPLEGHVRSHLNDRDPGRRLRIGYVSPDFRQHPVAQFLVPLLEHHDKSAVEIFCYAQVPISDPTTERLRTSADKWRSTVGLSDDAISQAIRRDRIDILVDLAGHTARNRLLVFARKPAPVQVTYLGYPDTTGLSAIDYRITDAFVDPPGMADGLHSEQLWRLPRCAWCFQVPSDAPAPAPPRHVGPVTFGSFNALAKLNNTILMIWAKLLGQVPQSRLLLKSSGLGLQEVRERVLAVLERGGVNRDRVDLMDRVANTREYFELFHRIDIALDSFPYHGTTTTCETLWMGVPVVTLAGMTHVSRVGVSLLEAVGLTELVAYDVQAYVHMATDLAKDLPRLAALRSNLRQNMERSPLMNGLQFARDIETAYRQMWQAWCVTTLP